MFDPIAVLDKTFDGEKWEAIRNALDFGTHVTNPYHNTTHMKLVAYHAFAAFVDSGGDPHSAKAGTLVLASLLHDYNHSGGVESDEKNIAETLRVLSQDAWQKAFTTGGVTSDDVFDLIRVTQYDGREKGFAKQPSTLEEKCIRDADLCMIFTPEGRSLLVGLFEEIHLRPITSQVVTSQHVNDFFSGNCEFLHNAEYFTKYGQRMKETQLHRSLEEFRMLLQLLTNKTITPWVAPAQ